MGITAGAGASDVLLGDGHGFVVQVRGAADAPVLEALHAVRADVLALGGRGTPRVTGPVLAPGGPIVRIAQLDVDDDVLLSIPDLVAKRLHDAGVTDAVVHVIAPGGPLEGLEQVRGAAVLRLFPPPAGDAGVLGARLLDAAATWVVSDHAAHEPLALRLIGLEHALPAGEVRSVLAQASAARAWCDVVHGDLEDQIRTASLTFGSTPHVALASGGPGLRSEALLEELEQLVQVARSLAGEVAYACVDLERTFEGLGTGLPSDGWAARGGAEPNVVAGQLVDTRVPGVFPFQVLGPGHLAVLGRGAADGPPLGEPLDGDRAGVAIGAPVDWLPGRDSRSDALEEGIGLLRPLLVGAAEVERVLRDRPAAPGTAPTAVAGPDLEGIELEPVPHIRRGLHLSLLELAAWLAGEPHTDAPASVSPVVATYARWLASAVDDETRQTLKPLAARLVGTADAAPARPGELGERDRSRVWQATEWIVRVQAPAWLRAAGLEQAAGRLAGIRLREAQDELLRAVDVMSAALLVASRRIDLALVTVGEGHGDTLLVEEAAWEAWEVASERSGWVAAAETAALGMPSELIYATDSRVLECVRDVQPGDRLDPEDQHIGDAAWAAALRAAARAAWRAGWRAALAAPSDAGVVPFATAHERARRAAADRSREPEQVTLALDSADAAAVDRLVEVALDRGAIPPGERAWDAARAAARSGPDGAVWALIDSLTRDAVEAEAWHAAMSAARDAVDAVLARAPDQVARAVTGALAKEVASASARGLAIRAAAVAEARGEGAEAVLAAAHDAVAPVTASLQAEAIAFVEVLAAAEDQLEG